MIGRFVILSVLMIAIACNVHAQAKNMVREGNKLYEARKYKEAAASYQQALQKEPTYTPGMFNLGNALYKQKQYDAARKAMAATAKSAKDKPGKSAANYNIGNSYMEEQKWQEAVDAYKQALKNNPQDADAKYNLSYALAMMKKNGGGGGGDKDKQDKDDKGGDKDKEQKDKEGDKKDEQDKQDQQQQQDKQDQNDQQDKEDKRPQPQPSKLSEQQAEQLLNALQQEEKKLQDKMQKGKATPVKVDKDW